jgi:hypothetical protein
MAPASSIQERVISHFTTTDPTSRGEIGLMLRCIAANNIRHDEIIVEHAIVTPPIGARMDLKRLNAWELAVTLKKPTLAYMGSVWSFEFD